MDADTLTRLSRIYRALSADECRQLKAIAYGDVKVISPGTVEKFIALKLMRRDHERVRITSDGIRVVGWC